MKTIFRLPALTLALATLTACVNFGPTKTAIKSNVYYCTNSGQNIATNTFNDGSLDLEYFNRVVSMQPATLTASGGTYKNKQMMWEISGEKAVLSFINPLGEVNRILDRCKLSQASSLYN